ncbi:MAG: Gfo/Idh/MocA family oxidoreductase [Oscillospiraceae bacterium]|nr:Gfo/Idh/MocA family oxidoreductase [Oscillospiraceae bacterium]
MNKVSVGVLGVGNMGFNHARVYDELSDVNLIGVCDVNRKKAKTVADRFGAVCFDTPEELLGCVQAISIASPTSLHLSHGLRAASAGVSALIEKPLAFSLEEGKQLVAAFSESGLVLQVGHVERYNPAVAELKKILTDERVLAINIQRLSADRRINDTGIIHDLMIHDIDLLNWLVDAPIEHIHAVGIVDALGNNSIDYAESLIKFENGIVAGLTASRITEDKIRTVAVHTANSFVQVDLINRSVQISRKTNYHLDIGHNLTYRQENIIEKVIVPQYEPLKAQLSDFVSCVSSGGERNPLVDGAAGCDAVRVADEISRLITS